jgi:hypothetical protein
MIQRTAVARSAASQSWTERSCRNRLYQPNHSSNFASSESAARRASVYEFRTGSRLSFQHLSPSARERARGRKLRAKRHRRPRIVARVGRIDRRLNRHAVESRVTRDSLALDKKVRGAMSQGALEVRAYVGSRTGSFDIVGTISSWKRFPYLSLSRGGLVGSTQPSQSAA